MARDDDRQLEKKAAEGNTDAQRSLALLYELGIDREADPEKAFSLWMKVAQSGDGAAQLTVAEMYEKGEGTPADNEKALYWRKVAAARNMVPWDSDQSLKGRLGGEISPKILIIDDDIKIQILLEARCKERGYQPVRALSSREAFTKINQHPDIGVILLDLVMPGGNGLQFLKAMRKMKVMEGVPVIIVSGEINGTLVPELTRLGVNGLYAKPIDYQKLFEKIESFVKKTLQARGSGSEAS